MSILAWIEDQRRLKLLNAPKYNHPASDGSQGLWTRCDNCGVILYIKHLKENQRVCFGCGFHLQMNSQERIDHLIDLGTWRPFDETLSPCDPLEFRDQKPYTERLREAQERTGLQDAIQTGTGMLDGIPIALGVMDFHFMGGSMGSAVGEKITRLIEYATQEGLTLVLVCASGGARMQEGILSLMQMAKISAALQVYQSCANLLYISVLTSPTTGGVTASFAMLGDLIFAEPKALIGFAGRRVIEQTLQEQLPDDFQTSEYLLHHGLLDLIVPRSFLKQALSETITLYKDAPLKLSGIIPYGIQPSLNFIGEEKVRRKWLEWEKKQAKDKIRHGIFSLENGNDLFNDKVSQSYGVTGEKSSQVLLNTKITSPYEVPLKNSPNANQIDVFESITNNEENWLRIENQQKSEFSYREILLSFYTMFQFLENQRLNCDVPVNAFRKNNKNFISVTPFNSLEYASSPTEERVNSNVTNTTLESLEQNSENKNNELATSLKSTVKDPSNSLPVEQVQHISNTSDNFAFLNKAISLAVNRTLQWRTFYMSSKVEPKKVLLNKLNQLKENRSISSPPTVKSHFFSQAISKFY